MKILKLFLFTFFCSISFFGNAQTGQTGSGSYDYEYQWLCDSASQTSFYRITLHRIGFASVVVGNYKPDGTAYTPTSTIKHGPCASTGTGSFPDSTYQYDYVELCDKSLGIGISYVAIFCIATDNTTGAETKYKIGNYVPNTGASYSPGGGTQLGGFCIGLALTAGTSINVAQYTASSGTLLYADNGMSVDIYNAGYNIALLTINGDNFELLPGERWFCHKQFEEITRNVYRCPAVTYNANYNALATTLHVTQTAY